jgi:hypothetical protein
MGKNNAVTALGEDYFEEFFFRFPIRATKRGIHRYDYRLGSFLKSDFEEWRSTLLDFKKKVFALKVKKRFQKSVELSMLERRIDNEIKWLGEEEFKSSPFLYVSTIYDGLLYPAFGSYAPFYVRVKNFCDRAADIENIVQAAKENLVFSEVNEKEFALKRINIIKEFFNEYMDYLSGKVDSSSKEEIKALKMPVNSSLDSLERIVNALPLSNNVKKMSFVKKIKREYMEDYPLKELQLSLKDRMGKLDTLIRQKAREIKISSSYRDVLRDVLLDEKEITLEEVLDIFEQIKEAGEPIFGKTHLSVDYRRVLEDSERKFNSLANLSSNIIIPPGPFDTHNAIPVLIVKPISIYKTILRLVAVGYPGRAYQSEILRRNRNNLRKMFNNALFNEGWEFYSKIEMREHLKKIFGLKFELVALYDQYVTLLKAYIENEILNNQTEFSRVYDIVQNDEIIQNKETFLYNVISENGKSLKSVIGLNSITYFLNKAKSYRRGIKSPDLHRKILFNSTLPFKFIWQAIKR